MSTTMLLAKKGLVGEVGVPNKWGCLVRAPFVRNESTFASNLPEKQNGSTSSPKSGGNKDEKRVVSYWGIQPSKIVKQDGTEWKWNCFKVSMLNLFIFLLIIFLNPFNNVFYVQPWETYKADVTIDLNKHHAPTTFLDKMAYWTVKSLRFPTDLFFQVYGIS